MVGVTTEIAEASGVGKCVSLRSWWERMKARDHGMPAGNQENGHMSLQNWVQILQGTFNDSNFEL